MNSTFMKMLVRSIARFSLAVALLAWGMSAASCVPIRNLYRAMSFSFVYPEGWKKVHREMSPPFGMKAKSKPYFIAFDCPEADPDSGEAVASLSFYVVKLTQQIWLEDEFPSIAETFTMSGYEVLDRGEIMIDEQISKWLVYRDTEHNRINLEFYVINDNNILFRIQYSAKQDKFALYRPAFETARNTMKLSKW